MRGGKHASSNEADCKDKDVPVGQRLADSRPHRRLPTRFKGPGFRPFGICRNEKRSLTGTSTGFQGFELLPSEARVTRAKKPMRGSIPNLRRLSRGKI